MLRITAVLFTVAALQHPLAHAVAVNDKIDHFVVLLMENRPFDQIFGCMAGEGELAPGADGINGTRSLPKDPHDPAAGTLDVTCGTGRYVCESSGGYLPWTPKFADPDQGSRYPYGPQDDAWSYKRGLHDGDAVHMFSGAQLPVKRQIARESRMLNTGGP